MADSVPTSGLSASRREFLIGSAGLIAAGALAGFPATAALAAGSESGREFITKDGTRIFYKDWGQGQPVVFSHGWPLSADAWDGQMLALIQAGYRVIAHDRRSHGRSEQTFHGNTMDQYVNDYAQLLDHLDIRDAILVGHSTGGGEVAHYIGQHGVGRVAKAVLVSAVPPLMLRTETNPHGTPREVFDNIRRSLAENRSQYYRELAIPFFGYNREGAKPLDGVIDSFWSQGMLGGIVGQYDCVHEFSEIDYTNDLKKMTVPTLVVHGDDDQIVPIAASGARTAEILPDATLKIYRGAPHGLPITRQHQLNTDLLVFIQS